MDTSRELSPQELIDLASELRDLGVEEFTIGRAHVKFAASSAPKVPVTIGEEHARPAAPATHYDRVFGDKKPTFPGAR